MAQEKINTAFASVQGCNIRGRIFLAKICWYADATKTGLWFPTKWLPLWLEKDWVSFGLGSRLRYVYFTFRQFWIRFRFHSFSCHPYCVSFDRRQYLSKKDFFRFLNQPMFKYNQKYGFNTMNYIMAVLCFLILLAPTACFLKERRLRSIKTVENSMLKVNSRLLETQRTTEKWI